MMTGIRSCNGAMGRVRRPRDDGERINRSLAGASSRSVSNLPAAGGLIHRSHKPAKAKRLAAFQHHPERLPLPVHFLPLVKTVSRYQAPPMLERLAKGRPAFYRFRPRIDQRIARAFILRPKGNQNPSASASLLADCDHGISPVPFESVRCCNAARKTAPAP